MSSFVSVKALCGPAFVYFVFSMIFLVLIILQNLSDTSSYIVGNFSCRVPSTIVIFLVKFVYILFWTWILHLICKDGHTGIAWLLLLIPFILFFIVRGLFLIYF